VTLVDGFASFTTTTLPVGVTEITAEYSGDNNYIAPPASFRVRHTVAPIATTTSIVASPPATVTGQSVAFTAQVAPAIAGGAPLAGTVSFWSRATGSPSSAHLGDVALGAAGA